MTKTMIFGILFAFPLTATSAAEGGATPSALPNIPVFLEQIEALRQEKRIPGLSIAVVRDGKVVLAAGLGYADPERRIPATADTPYRIASTTKPIAAVVALKLVERGVLDLDRPMAEYSDWADFCADFSRQPSIFARNLRCDEPAHTLRHLLSHTGAETPGARFSYNPVLYSWASRPMMAVTNTPFSTLVARHVFQPAGMAYSARINRDLPLRDDLARDLAPPHRVNEAGEIERVPNLDPQGDGAAGGIVSTVLDLARFDIALERGTLISGESREAMMTPARSADDEDLPYGLGWFIQDYEGHRLVWHSGWWEDAYSALYLKIPDRRLTLILLANGEGIWWGNPLDRAEVQNSEFARAFLRLVLDE